MGMGDGEEGEDEDENPNSSPTPGLDTHTLEPEPRNSTLTPTPTRHRSDPDRDPNSRPKHHKSSPPVIAAYNSAIRGLSEAGCFPEAWAVVARMRERGLLPPSFAPFPPSTPTTSTSSPADPEPEMLTSIDAHTKLALRRLARYSRGGSHSYLKRDKRQFYVVDGRRVYIDARRVEWLKEQGKTASGVRFIRGERKRPRGGQEREMEGV